MLTLLLEKSKNQETDSLINRLIVAAIMACCASKGPVRVCACVRVCVHMWSSKTDIKKKKIKVNILRNRFYEPATFGSLEKETAAHAAP